MASRLTPSAASGVTGAFIDLSDCLTERPFLAEYCPPPRFSEGSQSRQQTLKFSTSATASEATASDPIRSLHVHH